MDRERVGGGEREEEGEGGEELHGACNYIRKQ
jgi:hypothetical protein